MSSPFVENSLRYTYNHMNDGDDILEAAAAALASNDNGSYTMPSPPLYPHQWLWDSCFVAIGLRHLDTTRAKLELTSLLRGQWANGMLPNLIFKHGAKYRTDRNAWQSSLNPYSPDDVATSGITQPPMFSEAIVLVGKKLPLPERREWYKTMWQPLLSYHTWLYQDRDPHQEGLLLQIHPWEVGLDSTPPWTAELHEHQLPGWIRVIQSLHAEWLINLFRRDTRTVPSKERFLAIEALALFSIQRRLKRKAYVTNRVLNHSLFTIEDLTFNSIFIRANDHLLAIAKTIRKTVPEDLLENIERSRKAFESLWDPYTSSYYSRDFITHKLLKVPSIAGLMPLYSGAISKERAATLVKMLESDIEFGPAYPVPSVPISSKDFDANRYWQGPTWLNTNWLIIDGLRRYGYNDHADALTESSLELVQKGGFAEYFNPLTGEPLGADNFSWTAALTVDLLYQKPGDK